MKQHHMTLAKYWASTAKSFSAASLFHMAALFQRYADAHAEAATQYED